ncbi:MAG: hypothetical protein HZA10_07865 [Nitrospirae bacterium]|nr:hypothetical protein [Nitrospirota bacterium]
MANKMYSIYHFFKSLLDKKHFFTQVKKLEDFPFKKGLLSCKNVGKFPDMAIRINKSSDMFTGGELIELKDSGSYTVSSFNSTIPTGKKEISKIITGDNSNTKLQMEHAGNNIYSLPERDVFYLVRGRKKSRKKKDKIQTKVCLVCGDFFETIRVDDLISQSFSQVLQERLQESNTEISDELRVMLLSIFSQQENFSKVRTVDNASVKLRFRIMTEVKAEGNILHSKKYPEIKDNTLNFILPCHSTNEERGILDKAEKVFNKKQMNSLNIFKIKHHFNGYFLVFQADI